MFLPKIKIFRVKYRDKKTQFFDKHLSKTRKVQFRILMRSDALWYSDHSSSGSEPSIVYHPTPELLHHLNYARAVSDFIPIYLAFLLWYVK